MYRIALRWRGRSSGQARRLRWRRLGRRRADHRNGIRLVGRV